MGKAIRSARSGAIISKSWQRQSSFTVGMLEGQMEEGYLLMAHVRGLIEGNFASKSFVVIRLLGMMVLTVGGAASSTLFLFLEKLIFF